MTGLQTSVIPLFNTFVHTVQYIFPLQDPPGPLSYLFYSTTQK